MRGGLRKALLRNKWRNRQFLSPFSMLAYIIVVAGNF